MTDLDYYFDWYRFTEKSKTRFVRMRLIRSGKIYWTSTVVHEPTGSATNSDNDIRISSIQLGVRCSHSLLEMKTGVGLICSTPILHTRGKFIS